MKNGQNTNSKDKEGATISGVIDDVFLQQFAIDKFGMETQLQHAIEELTELSLEVQKALRFYREHGELGQTYELACEYCDARNALKTIGIFISERYTDKWIERIQVRKDNKFARIIGYQHDDCNQPEQN